MGGRSGQVSSALVKALPYLAPNGFGLKLLVGAPCGKNR